jgi:hypothetical protein
VLEAMTVAVIMCIVPLACSMETDQAESFEIIAGCSTSFKICFSSDEERSVSFDEVDIEGFDIVFSENRFSFIGSKNISVDITADIALAPGEYDIELPFTHWTEDKKGSSTIYIKGTRGEKPVEEEDENENLPENDQNNGYEREYHVSFSGGEKGSFLNINEIIIMFLSGIIGAIFSTVAIFSLKDRKEKK